MGPAPSTPASVLAPGEKEGPFALRRNPFWRDGVYRLPYEFRTVQHAYKVIFAAYADRDYLGHRPLLPDGTFAREYKFITYAQGYEIAIAFGSGLVLLGIGVQTPFGVYAPGCDEWVHAIDASGLYGFTIASLYDTLGPDSLDYLIGHSRMTCILVSIKYFPKLLPVLQANHHDVSRIILIEKEKVEDVTNDLKPLDITVHTFEEIVALGRQKTAPFPEFGPETHFFYCYSSGTTGIPKGVIIPHRSYVMAMASGRSYVGNVELPCHLSFLPYAHVFERVATGGIMFAGGRIGFISGSIQTMLDDYEILKPTLVIGVPRILNRFYEGIVNNVNAGGLLNKGIFWTAYKMKKFFISRAWSTSFWDRLVFNKIMAKFGANVTEVTVGGASCDPVIQEFFQILFGVPVRNGYGCTETGTGTIVTPDDIRSCRPGLSGGPTVGTEIRVEPLEDYDDPDCGEIILAGDPVCCGYLYDEEQTKKLFVDDTHWAIRTGDVGKFVDGHLKVVDRLRSIFKLSQGEYVAAEIITHAYEECKYIAQLFVYGDSGRTCLVGIVVPKIEEVAAFLGKEKLTPEEFAEGCKSVALHDKILEEMQTLGKAKGLFGFQQVKDIYVDSLIWTSENDLLTPTFKPRRKALGDHYAPQILEMYQRLEPPR